jgi:GNAT superfamily N-acetyltransferase
MKRHAGLRFVPLTRTTWKAFETLFGPRGACGGCWCMWWRLGASGFKAGRGAPNRRALRRLVWGGKVPGILALRGTEPVGWVAIAPRSETVRLAASRTLAPVDTTPVWSVTCFFVARAERRSGVTTKLLRAAVAHAREHGARCVEGYPLDVADRDTPAAFAWTGFLPAFQRAGFVEVARRSARQPIVRRMLRRTSIQVA